MALGTNLKAFGKREAWSKSLKVMGIKGQSKLHLSRIFIVTKNGAPATNTAADDPTKKGVFCYDAANKRLYCCTAYTNSTTFTWTRLDS